MIVLLFCYLITLTCFSLHSDWLTLSLGVTLFHKMLLLNAWPFMTFNGASCDDLLGSFIGFYSYKIYSNDWLFMLSFYGFKVSIFKDSLHTMSVTLYYLLTISNDWYNESDFMLDLFFLWMNMLSFSQWNWCLSLRMIYNSGMVLNVWFYYLMLFMLKC